MEQVINYLDIILKSISVTMVHSHLIVLTRHQKQCAHKPKINTFNVSTFCVAKDSTGQLRMRGVPPLTYTWCRWATASFVQNCL